MRAAQSDSQYRSKLADVIHQAQAICMGLTRFIFLVYQEMRPGKKFNSALRDSVRGAETRYADARCERNSLFGVASLAQYLLPA